MRGKGDQWCQQETFKNNSDNQTRKCLGTTAMQKKSIYLLVYLFPQSVKESRAQSVKCVVKCHYSGRDEVKQNYQAKFCRLRRNKFGAITLAPKITCWRKKQLPHDTENTCKSIFLKYHNSNCPKHALENECMLAFVRYVPMDTISGPQPPQRVTATAHLQ